MQISVLLNLASLIFGVSAWVLAFFAIKTAKASKAYTFTSFSFITCVLALMSQFFEISNRVSIGDYAAIEDTIGAVLMASVVLSTVTALLNLIAVMKARKK